MTATTAEPAPQDGELTRLFYRPAEVALLLGVTRQTVHNYIRAGELPSAKIGNTRLIPQEAVTALLR